MQARKSLDRILPAMEAKFEVALARQPEQWNGFKQRLERAWPRLFRDLHALYGWQYDFFYTLEQLVLLAMRAWLDRSAELRDLDTERAATPHWFLSEQVCGAVLYVDLFSEKLARLSDHIAYFKTLGINYLHLMPLFAVPKADNDGGYAVSDYRAINPDVGTMEELAALSAALRREGISLVLDFVFNHTADEHYWARKAKAGDSEYMNYYWTFPDRTLPDQFQRHLRDIFPTVRRGSFTWCEEMGRWVWTTFNSFQWDLNYANPEVFRAMAEEMLFLANKGVEVFRLDAVAFIWKRMGTDCENQPEAHTLISAFNALVQIVAPSVIFKSEAIVHPDEVVEYIHPHQCQLSYNPLLMALLWEALATREVKLLAYAMRHRSRIPEGCTWVNYLRCHDDIGWTFADEDARAVGIDPGGHRHFLNTFYTGRFPGAFARGVPFQFNPDNGDLRVSGTLSSLAGLEDALEKGDPEWIELAVRRINLLRSIIASAGGIPLLYLGDEWGMLNDYTFLTDPAKAGDSRWVHRCKRRWEARKDLEDSDTLEWRFFHEMVKLFKLRKSIPAFRNGGLEVIDTGNPHVFGYTRTQDSQKVVVVCNFSEYDQALDAGWLPTLGAGSTVSDLLHGEQLKTAHTVVLEGYRARWLEISR
ncbi:MAG: alpha-glucosidase C-terminal domain-containing protein [Desulfatitalea sp.]|nr:alpha-glucosidase C-terminal domain-containing protein [Desulfatitalea sp.]